MQTKRRVGIRDLKNQASRIVDEVRETHKDYVVTKRGKPVAVIRPWSEQDSMAQRQERADAVLSLFATVADRVAEAAGGRGAGTAVGRQRR